jgi:hypothetical protein
MAADDLSAWRYGLDEGRVQYASFGRLVNMQMKFVLHKRRITMYRCCAWWKR